jgi:transcriptional regulator with XRE-family HTH domain
MELRQIFAANLRKARHAEGLSQEALAWDADVDRRYMTKIENGATSVGLDIVDRLAKVLEVEPYELLMPRRGADAAAGERLLAEAHLEHRALRRLAREAHDERCSYDRPQCRLCAADHGFPDDAEQTGDHGWRRRRKPRSLIMAP